jgi:hypothetical protein
MISDHHYDNFTKAIKQEDLRTFEFKNGVTVDKLSKDLSKAGYGVEVWNSYMLTQMFYPFFFTLFNKNEYQMAQGRGGDNGSQIGKIEIRLIKLAGDEQHMKAPETEKSHLSQAFQKKKFIRLKIFTNTLSIGA